MRKSGALAHFPPVLAHFLPLPGSFPPRFWLTFPPFRADIPPLARPEQHTEQEEDSLCAMKGPSVPADVEREPRRVHDRVKPPWYKSTRFRCIVCWRTYKSTRQRPTAGTNLPAGFVPGLASLVQIYPD